ncbi:MAG: vitamin B12 dependent-methionine synthase activation domain-containing protein [Prolixibacteraceae bacterium]
MTEEYKFSFDELGVETADIEELFGVENAAVPEPFPDLIKRGLNEAPDHCDIRGGIKLFNSIKTDISTNSIKINNQLFKTAKIVATQLKNATGAALFTCTAGKGISDYARKTTQEGDPMYSYVLDVIGSITVDKAMDRIQESLKKRMAAEDMGISDRFSPGYCEWDVAEQQKLFQLLPANFCGITLTGSSLMEPIKSVSGIIGIGPGLQEKGYQCQWCNDLDCIYGKRKRGTKKSD